MKISLNSTFRICCYLSLAISFLPVVDYYSPWYVTLFPAVIALGITLYRDRNIYPLMIALFSIFGLWVLTYWTIYRNYLIGKNFINFFISFLPCILAVQTTRTETDKMFYEGYLKALSIFVGITCITTMIGLAIYPMASRELASGSAIYDTERYTRINIGGYEFIYALVLLIPLFVWLIKRTKGFWKSVYITVLVLDICCIYASQYTIALVCVFVTLIVMLMQKDARIAWIGSILIIMFLMFNGLSVLGKIFYWASDVINQQYTADRLLQLAQFFSGETINTATSSARLDYYINQINVFGNSPLWGHNWLSYSRQYVSGHTLILDILGGSGILGFGCLVFLSRQTYVLAVNPQRQRLSPYVRVTWIMAFMLAILNPVTFPPILTVMFMGCMCINQLQMNQSIESVRGKAE